MTIEKDNTTSEFRRKVYTRMYNDSISHIQADQEKPRKKIIPTSRMHGIREDFKKTFLPLLIDVFELRQMIQNSKNRHTSPLFLHKGTIAKSPKEIIEKLQQLQDDIEESKRWCEGIIMQIAKGIEEAKEALQFIENSSEMELSTPSKPKGLQENHKITVDSLLKRRSKNHFWNFFKTKKDR